MSGPPPMPSNLVRLRGNPGRKPLLTNEPQPEVSAPTCPSWLDQEAKREWRRVVPLLIVVRCLSKQDRAMLAAYCATWSRLVAAQTRLNSGRLTRKTSGGLAASPEVRIVEQAVTQLLRISAEFGLTPASRSRINAPDNGTREDPATKILGW